MACVESSVEAGPAPLFGSDGTTTGLYKEVGPFNPKTDQPVIINKGQEDSSGWSLDIAVDIPFGDWAKECGFSPGASYTEDHNSTIGVSVPVNIPVPATFFTYPEYIDTYNRYRYTWREFDQGGEIIAHNPDGSVKPHSHSEDIYAASQIVFATPVRIGTPMPQYNPTPVYTPD